MKKTALKTIIFSLILSTLSSCIMPGQKTNKNPSAITTSDNNTSTNNNTGGDPGGDTTVTTSEIVMSEVDVGVKPFEQINETFSVLTGVPSSTNQIDNTYQELANQLPTESDIKSFLASHQVGITKLAAEYCDAAVNSGNFRSGIWPNFNFNQTPNQIFVNNAAGKLQLIDPAATKFWGGYLMNAVDEQAVKNELMVLIDDLMNAENLNDAATTRKLAKGVCTAMLSSAYVTLL